MIYLEDEERHCPDCGNKVYWLIEGRCLYCHKISQSELDRHNTEYYEWQRLSDSSKDIRIKEAS